MSMVAIQTPEQTEARFQAQNSQRQAAYAPPPINDALARHVRSCWGIAKEHKAPITTRLLDCMRRRAGEYSPEKLASIKKTKGSEIYMMITAAKCRAAKAWLSDLFNPAGDRAWTLDPSPVPDLPDDIKHQLVRTAMEKGLAAGLDPQTVQAMLMQHKERLLDELEQEAERRAELMEDEIEDLLGDAGFRQAFDEFLDDLVTFPFAVIKGLEYRSEKTLTWVDIGNGQFQPEVKRKVTPKIRRVSPFSFYPAPSVTTELEGHWNIEHHRFTRRDLASMRDAPGYNAQAIAMVLTQYSAGGLKEWLWSDGERERIEGRKSTYSSDEIDCIEWCGSLQGQMLINWGMNQESVPDPLEEYAVSVMVVGNYTIRAMVNPDPSGKSEYNKACWEEVPGAFCGKALPELMSDCQDMCNGVARSLANNMAISSGPQVWVEMDRIAPGANVNDIYPYKVWQSKSGQHSGHGIGFFQPDSNANELMAVYEKFSKFADEITGLPAYAYGSDSGAGAAKTASGLSMLMNAASKTIKHVVRNVDIHIIEPMVDKTFNYVMLTSDKAHIKGDVSAHARGSESLIHKEQSQMRQQELLGITGNPIDMQILGIEGRSELLREVLKSGDLPVDRVLGSNDDIAARMQPQPQAAQPAPQLPQG